MREADTLAFQTKDWSPIPRISRTIPFGYELSPDDPNLLLPNVFELEALEQAKKHLRQYSYRDVANWLSSITGRYISHVGLKKRMEIERSRRTKAHALKNWANRIKEAEAKVEKFEKNRLGAGASIITDS